jgi:hypothetical protein
MPEIASPISNTICDGTSGREISDTAAQDRLSRPEGSRQLAARAADKNQHRH